MPSLKAGRFGQRGRERFLAFHPPEAPRERPHGVLLCNPFGQEAIRAHRLLRVMAERLAREGHAVMRFDYFGTGDSDGDDHEGDLQAWTDDVIEADRELGRLCGAENRTWFGLRLGGTLAALASRRAPSSRHLVLWDPVADGRAYLRELSEAQGRETKALQGNWHPARIVIDPPDEALGYPLPAPLRAQLAALAPAQFSDIGAGRVTFLAGVDTASLQAMREAIAGAGVPVSHRTLASRTLWTTDEATNTSLVPHDGLQAVVQALGESP